MSVAFLDQVNELIVESIVDIPDDEILLEMAAFPDTKLRLESADKVIKLLVDASRENRLAKQKRKFQEHQGALTSLKSPLLKKRSISDMLGDIVSVIHSENVPKGVLIAFRNQGESGADEDIKEIWESLSDLGLIAPDKDDK